MEIRLNRNDLLGEVAPMQGIVERKTTIPVLSHILLRAEGDRLHLAATDLDVSLTSWCQAEVSAPGGIAVQAKKFMEIIRSLVGDEVRLEQTEPQRIQIRAGRSRFKIHGMRPEDFPTLPEVSQEYQIEIPFADFRRMIGKVIFAVSAEESRFQLNGALLKLKGGSLEMVATDGHRLALVEEALDGGAREDAVLVPRKALQELQRLEGEGEQSGYRRGEHHLSFRLGRRELICRILEGTFPDYERVIAQGQRQADRLRSPRPRRRRPAGGAAHRRPRPRRAPPVRPRRAGHLGTQNPDLGEATEEVACDYDGPEFKIGLNPDYLREFLAALEGNRVRLELKDENSQCVGYPEATAPAEGEESPAAAASRYLCVIMPMRV